MTEMQSLRLRSNIARRKAILAGLLYVFGSIGLAIASCLPLISGLIIAPGYGEISVTNFWRPIQYMLLNLRVVIGDRSEHVLGIVSALLYGSMILICVINAFRAISKMDHLCMKGNRRAGYNQNKIAVDSLGKIFSGSFFTISVHTVAIMLLYPLQDTKFTTVAIVVAAAFLVIHFVSGALAGTISRFTVRDEIAEYPRRHVIGTPILRNAAQFVAIGALAFFLKDFCVDAASKFFIKWVHPTAATNQIKEMLAATPGILRVLELGLWIVAFFGVVCLYRHVIYPTEFYAVEKDKARKVVRFVTFNLTVVLFMASVVCVATGVVAANGSVDSWAILKDNLYLILSVFVSGALFVFECVMANEPKLKKCYRPEPVVEEEPTEEVSMIYEALEEEKEPDSAAYIYDEAKEEETVVEPQEPEAVEEELPNALFFYDESREEPVAEATGEVPAPQPVEEAAEEEMPNAIFFYDEVAEEPKAAEAPAKTEEPAAKPVEEVAEEDMPNAIFFYDEAVEEPKATEAPAKSEEPAAAKPIEEAAEEEMPNAIFFYDEAAEEPKATEAPAKSEEPAAAKPVEEVTEEDMPNAIFFYDEAAEEPKATEAPAKSEEPAASKPIEEAAEEEMPNAIFFYDEAVEEPKATDASANSDSNVVSNATDTPVEEEYNADNMFLYFDDDEEKAEAEDRDDMLLGYDMYPENVDEMALGYDTYPEDVNGLVSNYPVNQYGDSSKRERDYNKQQRAAQAKSVREKWVEKGRNARIKKFSNMRK